MYDARRVLIFPPPDLAFGVCLCAGSPGRSVSYWAAAGRRCAGRRSQVVLPAPVHCCRPVRLRTWR